MSTYFSWKKTQIEDFSEKEISKQYSDGFVFTRLGKGIMNQTRSLRIDLSKFKLSSENRRVLRHTSELSINSSLLPVPLNEYDFKIQKLAKDFYTGRFGEKLFSANKVKELLTSEQKSNYNLFLNFTIGEGVEPMGYCICYSNSTLLHYCYPFYNYTQYGNNYGMSMMLNAILYAQSQKLKYFYIGSATRKSDKYKLDFEGLEWFDGEKSVWSQDIEKVKDIIKDSSS
jgi:arginyl-tRNA--protein-N-Asp/Glu arginylyltransferase